MAAGATQRNIPVRLEALEFGEIVVSTTQLLILLGIAVLTGVMHLILKRTWFGRAVRAVTQDPVGAQICGVQSTRMKALTFAFGSATVAIAAVLYVLSFPVDPYMGFGLTVKAFTIIIVGGIGNLPGALLAGVFLGVAEGLTGLYWKPEWAPALSVILMLLILVTYPKGVGVKT
jgi:branched-chain amino acid transport system permease protein